MRDDREIPEGGANAPVERREAFGVVGKICFGSGVGKRQKEVEVFYVLPCIFPP